MNWQVKNIPQGEVKYRIDVAASAYLFGVQIRITVFTKEYSLAIGKGL